MLTSPNMNTQLVATFLVTSVGQRSMRGVPNSLEHILKLSVQSGDPRLPPLVYAIFHGYFSPLSFAQRRKPKLICLKSLTQVICFALALERANAGRRRPAKMAMMAITTSNSISVNATMFSLSFIILSAPQMEGDFQTTSDNFRHPRFKCCFAAHQF